MQLTKDDVLLYYGYKDSPYKHNPKKVLDFSKFQQVVDFIDRHPYPVNLIWDAKNVYDLWMKYYELENLEDDDQLDGIYQRWLFKYCFKDGLK